MAVKRVLFPPFLMHSQSASSFALVNISSCRQAFHFFHWPSSRYGKFYPSISLVSAQGVEALTFVLCDKSKQKRTKVPEIRKNKKSPRPIYVSFGVGQERSDRSIVAISLGDFFISALCFKGALFRTSLFKTTLNPIDRYFAVFTKSLLV